MMLGKRPSHWCLYHLVCVFSTDHWCCSCAQFIQLFNTVVKLARFYQPSVQVNTNSYNGMIMICYLMNLTYSPSQWTCVFLYHEDMTWLGHNTCTESILPGIGYRPKHKAVCLLSLQAIINSTITPNMTFTKTSQKFGQWADSRANTVYGLGFATEQQLNHVNLTAAHINALL